MSEKIIKWSKGEGRVLKGAQLYKIPCYWGYKTISDLSIWGGEIKPDYFIYLLIRPNNKFNIISFFKTIKEAQAYIK